MPETSIIIRTKNEGEWLEVVLENIFNQTYKNFEVIIIDSGSKDKTLEIAKRFPVKVFEIPAKDFSYPYALNYGINRAEATKYIIILSAHSIPVSNTCLEDGLNNFRKYKNIMGVYGFLKPLPRATFWDRFFMSGLDFLRQIFDKSEQMIIDKDAMGVMGFTNAIILKELWNKKNFNEDYGLGGEDVEWAKYWFNKGYRAIKDRRFTVKHSHNLGLFGWYKQFQYWKSLGAPHSFNSLKFRKDKTHSD